MTRPLPRSVSVPNGPTITVARGPLAQHTDACYDFETRTIVVDEALEGVRAHVALLHEFLHAVEDHLRRTGQLRGRVPHGFLERGDTVLLAMLVSAGLYRGVSRADMLAHLEAE